MGQGNMDKEKRTMNTVLSACLWLTVAMCLMVSFAFAEEAATDFITGNPEIQSVSKLAFGPNGVMFIGDSMRGAVFAIDTGDVQAASPTSIEIKGVNDKIASLLGIPSDQLLINDVEVNPISRNVYIAVSRGRGPDGIPVILRVNSSGKIWEYSLANVKYSVANLLNTVENKPDLPPGRNPAGPINANPRIDTITDLKYVDGKVLVAGLSNEEFASDLRSIPFPFTTVQKGTGIKIWHSSHGQYETSSPVRTFIPYMVGKQQNILAAYTCTPLVKIPVDSLKPGAKVVGTTVAETGNSNRPLEMISYRKDGHDYVLMATSKRGVMRLTADAMGNMNLTPPASCETSVQKQGYRAPKECSTDVAGLPLQSMTDLKGVWQLSKLDDSHALILTDSRGTITFVPGVGQAQAPEPGASFDLVTIPLP
jgi:hypothetical protein